MTAARTPPKTKTQILNAKLEGRAIPGPIRVEVIGETIWAAGGHDFSGVLRYANGVWTMTDVEPLLNFVIAISDREAIVGGESGKIGRTVDAGATWTWESSRGGWHVSQSRDRAGRVWIGQEHGKVWRAKTAKASFELVATLEGTVNTVRQIDDTDAIVVTEKVVHRMKLATGKHTVMFESTGGESFIDAACDPRGRIVLVADGGRAWLSDNAKTFESVDTGAGTLDFDAVFWTDGWFTVLGYDGALRVSTDGRAWTRIGVEKNMERLGGIAPWRDGWIVGGLKLAKGRQVGTLAFLGDPAAAPIFPAYITAKDENIDRLAGEKRTEKFTIAERNALLWATTWAALPDAEAHAAAWMKLAERLRRG